MKKTLVLCFIVVASLAQSDAQTCSTCGGLGNGNSQDIGPAFNVSMGGGQYGQSVGSLIFSSSMPNGLLYTPAALQFNAPTRTDVAVLTTNLLFTNIVASTNVVATVTVTTNVTYVTNSIYDSTGTNLIPVIGTNVVIDQSIVVVTNTAITNVVTSAAIRQVIAPQMLADIPVPPTTNGYVINFYFASQVSGTNSDGTYAMTGSPFVTWTVTNPAPSSINQIQISQTNSLYGSIKQWNYAYTPSTGSWSVTDLGGIQQNVAITNLTGSSYQVSNSWQYAGGPIVQQTLTTYAIASWGVAPVEVDVGSGSGVQTTTYSYNGSGLLSSVTHPDGSWEYYTNFDANGNPSNIYSSFNDVAIGSYTSGRLTAYTYNPTNAGVSILGDHGSANPDVPRLTSVSVGGHEISRSFTAFPSAYERLDIQCASSNAISYASDNLVTTSLFYTSGPNQFALQAVIHPDKTMTMYGYSTNFDGTYRTNITATGVPNGSQTYIVDGISNNTVLNGAGYTVYADSYDVVSGIMLSQDTYTNFDDYGRPTLVAHLDGTTDQTHYACCGLDSTTNTDGMVTQYLYDASSRQIGYEKSYSGVAIGYINVLDASSRVLQSLRVGSDTTTNVMSQAQYDLAGEIINQTNALNGTTTRSRTNDATTKGLIIATLNPDLGTSTNYYYADGSLKKVTGTAVPPVSYTYGVDFDGSIYSSYTLEVKLTSSGGTNEWTKTYTDMLGRPYMKIYADSSVETSSYNNLGQLIMQVDPDYVTTLYQYNTKGEQTTRIINMDESGYPDLSNDQITFTTTDVTNNDAVSGGGVNVRRTRTYVQTGTSSSNQVSTVDVSVDGLKRWNGVWNNSTAVANSSQTVYSGATNRSETRTAPDSSYTVSAYQCGRLVSVTRKDSGNNQIGQTSYTYDAHGRQYTVTDARNGATTYTYNNNDQVGKVVMPAPGNGQGPQQTLTYYDNMGRLQETIQPDNTSVTNMYYPTGQLEQTSGSRTYPVGYTYDAQGRMKTITTWTNFASSAGTSVTTWNYDQYRGFLSSKLYDNGIGPTYQYTGAGRLYIRSWARGINITYSYDTAGRLATVTYSGGAAPNVAYGYNQLGRMNTISYGATTCNLTYNNAGQVLNEAYTGGTLDGYSITNVYDGYLRRTTNVLLHTGTALATSISTFDAALLC